MRLASLAPVTLAIVLSAGCGARTGEDELLTTDLSVDGGGSGATAGAGGQSAGGTSGAGGAPVTGGASSGGGQNASCCQPSAGRGCPANPSLASCVCESDPFCCTGAWDETCVLEIERSGCGMCLLGTGGSSTGGTGGEGSGGQAIGGQGAGGQVGTGGVPPEEDCCLAHSSTGCFNQGIEECVCQEDAFCCETGWDFGCVERATSCGARCPATGGAGGQNTGGEGSGGAAGGAGGSGGQNTGGQGMGGSPYCDYLTPGTCESCACNYCYDPLVACLDDAGCTCILASGCSGVAECMSDEYCGDELSAGGAFTSIGRAYQLVSCQSNSDCPCF